jgi:hypothetical protein
MEYLGAATLAPPALQQQQEGTRVAGAREAIFITTNLRLVDLLRLPEAVVHFSELLNPGVPVLVQLREDPMTVATLTDWLLAMYEVPTWLSRIMENPAQYVPKAMERHIIAAVCEMVRGETKWRLGGIMNTVSRQYAPIYGVLYMSTSTTDMGTLARIYGSVADKVRWMRWIPGGRRFCADVIRRAGEVSDRARAMLDRGLPT